MSKPDEQQQPKQVPPRNNLKKVDIYSRSKAHEIAGQDPDCVYEFKSTDPSHPSYCGKYAGTHEIGNAAIGFAQVDGWEYVNSREVTSGAPRADQGKPIDTAIRHGSMVLMKTSKENHAAYAEIDRLQDDLRSKSLKAGDKETYNGSNGGTATYAARAGVGFSGDHRQLLNSERGA